MTLSPEPSPPLPPDEQFSRIRRSRALPLIGEPMTAAVDAEAFPSLPHSQGCAQRPAVPLRGSGPFSLGTSPCQQASCYPPFHGVVFRRSLHSALTTMTALTPHGRIRLPQLYSPLARGDFHEVSLGHPVFLLRSSPCLTTHIQSHCGSPCFSAVCSLPYGRTGLHHLGRPHPLDTPPRPNHPHAVAWQTKTGRSLGLRPFPRPPHGVTSHQSQAIPLDGPAERFSPCVIILLLTSFDVHGHQWDGLHHH